MKNIKKCCLEILDTVLDIKNRDGGSMVLVIDQKLKNEPKFCDSLNRKIPLFLWCILENINENKYVSLEEMAKDIFSIVRKHDALEGPYSFNKCSSVVKRSIRAKIENIKAEENLTEKKRAHKSSSFYAEDEISDQAINTDSAIVSRRPANTVVLNDKYNFPPSDADISIGHLLNMVTAKTDPTGYTLITEFYRLPTKRKYPEYYDIVKNPISFSKIRRNFMTNKYRDYNEITDDFNLMFNNSLKYYPTDSLMYKLAAEFIELINDANAKLNTPTYSRKRKYKKKSTNRWSKTQVVLSDDENPPKKIYKTKKKSPKKVRQIYMKLIKIRDKSDSHHLITSAFRKVPSIEEYPEYYQIIKQPIDLNVIGENVRLGNYKNARNFLDDMSTLISNARFFNKKSSQIYKDAVLIENYLMTNFGHKISQLIEKKLKSMKELSLQVNSKDHAISEMLSLLFKATDSNKNKLVKLIGLQKTFKELRNNPAQFSSVEELYPKIMSIIRENVDLHIKNTRIYINSLILMKEISNKFLLLHTLPSNTFIATPNQIICRIFGFLSSLKDEFDLLYIDSLSHVNYQENFLHSGSIHTCWLNLLSIKDLIDNDRYQRVECFQTDFLCLLKAAKESFQKKSEPYIHALKLYTKILQLHDELFNEEEYVWKSKRDFFFEFIESPASSSNGSGCESSPHSLSPISNTSIGMAVNKTGEELYMQCIDFVALVKFKETTYAPGDFVLLSENNIPLILLIRKLFCLKSGKKAFIGNLVLKPHQLNLLHNRKFARNELVLTNNHFCYKVKQISQKLNVLHARLYKRQQHINMENLYIFHTLYDSETQVLYPLDFKTPNNQEIDELVTFRTIERELEIISKNNNEKIPISESDMFVHMLRKNNTSNIIDETGNSIQILHKNILFRQGDFIKIKNSQLDAIYEIRKILPNVGDHVNQQENSHSLSCLTYLTVDSLNCFPLDMFYPNEIFQTETIINIELHQIVEVCCCLPEDKYLTIRPTQYREDQVFVCRNKLVDNKFNTIEPLSININTFPDEIKIFLGIPKFYKLLGAFFEQELSRNLEKMDLLDKKISKGVSASAIDINTTPSDYSKILKCNWIDCTQTFTSNLRLFNHFCTYHSKIIKSEPDKQNYVCKWVDCPHSLQLNDKFPSYSRLQRHVRDAHCKSLGSASCALWSDGHPKDHDYLTHSEPLFHSNPLNNPVILLRDAYIDSLLKLIEKKDNDIDLLRHEVGNLKDKLNENTEISDDIGMPLGQQTYQTMNNGSVIDSTFDHDQTCLYHSPLYRNSLNHDYSNQADKTIDFDITNCNENINLDSVVNSEKADIVFLSDSSSFSSIKDVSNIVPSA